MEFGWVGEVDGVVLPMGNGGITGKSLELIYYIKYEPPLLTLP